jgi:hypothetical protein
VSPLLFFEALVAKSACLRFLLDPGVVAAEAALELTPVSTPIVARNLLVGVQKAGYNYLKSNQMDCRKPSVSNQTQAVDFRRWR